MNLINDKDSAKWDMLFKVCEADLGAEAPHWLEVCDDLLRALREPRDLAVLDRAISERTLTRIALLHLDHARTDRITAKICFRRCGIWPNRAS